MKVIQSNQEIRLINLYQIMGLLKSDQKMELIKSNQGIRIFKLSQDIQSQQMGGYSIMRDVLTFNCNT